MKSIQEIEKLSAADLARIGDDESIPLPEDLSVQLPGGRRYDAAGHKVKADAPARRKRPAALLWSAAASVALVAGLGMGFLLRSPEPRDTFSDPYLAYAAVEQALNRMGGSVQQSADLLARTETEFNKINYWK